MINGMIARVRLGAVAIGMVAALSFLGGCDSSLKDENALLMEENEGLRDQLVQRNDALDSAHAELRERDNELARLQRQLQDETAKQPENPFTGIPGVKGTVGGGEVTASVESDVLFDPGKSQLKSTAKQSLNAVAGVLKSNYSGMAIRVAGHTDTDPIKKSGFKSNHHLAFERAYAVRDYLISRGVPSSSIYIASHGPDRAKSTKSASRRVEIAVVLNETS